MMRHAFSIDLEDWYQGIELPFAQWHGQEYRLEKGLDVVLELLAGKGVKATFFCLGWIAEAHPAVVRKIFDSGHEIASHGYSHEKIYSLDRNRFAEETRKTKGLLEDITGSEVRGYRAPYFSITRESLWALEVLKESGFKYDCSISPVETWRYGISSSPDHIYNISELDLLEFPVSTFNLMNRKFGVGGAYFRIFPFFFFHKFFENAGRSGKPGMFYAHPWEFDPEHPVIQFHWKATLTHYFNLKNMSRKTEKLLRSFTFTTVSEVIDSFRRENKISNVSLARLSK